MRVSSAAIFTLAAVIPGNITQSAMAATESVATQSQTVKNIVIPETLLTPALSSAIASPESLTSQEFSVNPVVVNKNTATPTKIESNTKSEISNNTNKTKQVIPVLLTNKNVQKIASKAPVVSQKVNPTPVTSTTPENDKNLVVIATNVKVEGVTPELESIIRKTIKTQMGGETSQIQLQGDVKAILDTGLLESAKVKTRVSKDGLDVVYQVKPIVVRSLQLKGERKLTYQVAREKLQGLLNKPISPADLKQVVEEINQWYADNGYKMARVLSIQPNRQGILTMNVAEGLVSKIQFRFVNDKGETVDKKGKPVKGRTKTEFLQKQLKLKPGEVFQESLARQDLQRLYATGLFKIVNVALEGDANNLNIVYLLKEVGARSVNLGGGINGDQGLVASLSYKDGNVGGVKDSVAANVKVGGRHIGFDTKFTSPYRASEPNRLGYSVRTFRRRELSDTFDSEIKLANGDKVREGKIGASLSFQRPIEGWDTSLGFNYTRTSIRDRNGNITSVDERGNPLSFSDTGIDDLATVSFSATKDRRNNRLNPTQGSVLKVSTEQSVPLGQGNISMNRLRANYSQYLPVKLFDSKQTQVFAFNVEAGTVVGDLPPYETFNLGGSGSVRGYDSGDVGNGRSFVIASAEYRFPVWNAVGGVVFADFASDLGSGDTVVGDPAGNRGKPGSGIGYGAGIRFNSPLGLLRADYGMNDQGESKLHFGFGHSF
ncbi:MAG: BamA/TamA family outer membrane protein [Nostocaceae cyanobacterium]|nr:BamA/TamA family outer membrane protein [Nostocaceae cyanobacterium]